MWAEINLPGLAWYQVPIVILLTSSDAPVQIKQYSMTLEIKREIAVHISWLRETGLLVPCQPPGIQLFCL